MPREPLGTRLRQPLLTRDDADRPAAYGTPGPPPGTTTTPAEPRYRKRVAAALGVALPERIVPNAPIAERLGVDDAWIETRTGIRERRHAEPEERLSDLAARAGGEAIARAGVPLEEIDLVLVATTTADEVMPNAAPLVAHELGLGHAQAFDVGAACTGFVAALSLAAGMLESGRVRHALVVGADLMSRVLDHDDRRTAGLFGDGAGALVVGGQLGPRFGEFAFGVDGGGASHICVPRGGTMAMAGQETFRAAVKRLTEAIPAAAAREGLGLDDIDLVVVHQANRRILRAVGERLELDPSRVVDCIDLYGNTSAATVPLALWAAERDGRLVPGSRTVVAAFGAGFQWGAGVVEWTGT
jgi:3-oxoacyl-[acyl-carrier-protein] synthase III